MLPPLITPTSSFVNTSSTGGLGSGTKRKSPDEPDLTKKTKASYCRDLFESKALDQSAVFCTPPYESTVLAQVFFIASGNSPNVKKVIVNTSSPIRKMSSPKHEKKSPTGRGKKKLSNQSNKLTSYFTLSPKNLEKKGRMDPEIIVISDDSEDSAMQLPCRLHVEAAALQPDVKLDSDIIVISDEESIINMSDQQINPFDVSTDTIDDSSSFINISDQENNSFDVSAYSIDDSSSDISESQLRLVAQSPVKNDASQFLSQMSSHTASLAFGLTDISTVKQESQIVAVSGLKKKSLETEQKPVEVIVVVKEDDDYLNPEKFVHQGIPGCLCKSADPSDDVRISVKQLSHFYKKPPTDSDDVAIRLHVGYSPQLAENYTWPVENNVVAGIASMMIPNQWYLALAQCQNFTDNVSYLPSDILQHVMHNVLHNHDDHLVSWSLMVLHKSVRLHPAFADCMGEHYLTLLTNTYLLKPSYPSCNVAILDQVLELLSQLCTESQDKRVSPSGDGNLAGNTADLNIQEVMKKADAENVYSTLGWTEKLSRISSLLEFIVVILEQDIVKCVNHEGIPIVSQIFWPKEEQRNVGMANAKCRQLFKLLRQTLKMSANKFLVRLVAVMAEAVLLTERNSDAAILTPISKKCLEFARSIYLIANGSNDRDLTLLAVRLKPYWLQKQIVQLATSLTRLSEQM